MPPRPPVPGSLPSSDRPPGRAGAFPRSSWGAGGRRGAPGQRPGPGWRTPVHRVSQPPLAMKAPTRALAHASTEYTPLLHTHPQDAGKRAGKARESIQNVCMLCGNCAPSAPVRRLGSLPRLFAVAHWAFPGCAAVHRNASLCATSSVGAPREYPPRPRPASPPGEPPVPPREAKQGAPTVPRARPLGTREWVPGDTPRNR